MQQTRQPLSHDAHGALADALANDAELVGAPDELAERLGMTVGELGTALRSLLAARRVAALAHADGRLSVCWK